MASIFRALWLVDFYPRPPRGGRRPGIGALSQHSEFLSTPSARRATYDVAVIDRESGISIHALREEGDILRQRIVFPQIDFYPRPPRGGRPGRFRPPWCRCNISIHALREEGDFTSSSFPTGYSGFLSTPSARRATFKQQRHKRRHKHFYPRPPRGGRQQKQRQNLYFQTNCTTFCTNLEEP